MTPDKDVRARFQIVWILRFAAVSALGSVLLLLLLRRMFIVDIGTDFRRAFFALRNLESLLVPTIGFSILFYVIVVSVLAAAITLFVSHRLAGPIFKLEGFARRLGRGDLTTELVLRGGDQLGALASAAGDLQRRLAADLAPLAAHLEAMDRAWDSLDSASAEEYETRARDALTRIERELTAFRVACGPSPSGD